MSYNIDPIGEDSRNIAIAQYPVPSNGGSLATVFAAGQLGGRASARGIVNDTASPLTVTVSLVSDGLVTPATASATWYLLPGVPRWGRITSVTGTFAAGAINALV